MQLRMGYMFYVQAITSSGILETQGKQQAALVFAGLELVDGQSFGMSSYDYSNTVSFLTIV